jgi:hypothetical protein
MTLIQAIDNFESALRHMGEMVGMPRLDGAIKSLDAAHEDLRQAMVDLEGDDSGTDATDYLRCGEVTEGVTHNGITYVLAWDLKGRSVVLRLARIRDVCDVMELNHLYKQVPDHEPGSFPIGSEVVGKPIVI